MKLTQHPPSNLKKSNMSPTRSKIIPRPSAEEGGKRYFILFDVGGEVEKVDGCGVSFNDYSCRQVMSTTSGVDI